MSQALILLGTNQGDRVSFLKKAINLIENNAGRLKKKSSIYETSPWGFQSASEFLNQVLIIETELNPEELLKQLKLIETELGRKKINSNGYESRNIDIDILFYDQIRYASKELQIPHPRILDRKFTLVPLIEVAGHYIHPDYGETIEKLAENCKDYLKVELFEMVNSI